ncbi:MAG: hypothetical protein JKY54_06055 [Flavobacteriales bacterium]|nr:hypothetical protein [Flavobacteriales bacterium]
MSFSTEVNYDYFQQHLAGAQLHNTWTNPMDLLVTGRYRMKIENHSATAAAIGVVGTPHWVAVKYTTAGGDVTLNEDFASASAEHVAETLIQAHNTFEFTISDAEAMTVGIMSRHIGLAGFSYFYNMNVERIG